MSSTSEQPSTPQPQVNGTVVDAGTAVVVEPPVPETRTVVVTTKPALIPDENATAWCLTRRNIVDAVIAILIAAGIIYLVISWRRTRPSTGLSRSFAATSTLGARTAPRATGFRPGADISGIGQQLTGGVKKFLKSLFK